MNNDLNDIERIIGYRFKDKRLLQTALTHASYANEHKTESNERLEFLGDSLLNFIVSENLYHVCSNEAEMTVARSKIVSRTPLALAVERLRLMDFMRLGTGAVQKDRLSMKFKSNLFEALVGAVYLDGKDLTSVKKFIYDNLDVTPDTLTDYKSRLQEYVQAKKLGQIVYRCKNLNDSVKPLFFAEVYVGQLKVGEGYGDKKKDAEKDAAKKALNYLNAP